MKTLFSWAERWEKEKGWRALADQLQLSWSTERDKRGWSPGRTIPAPMCDTKTLSCHITCITCSMGTGVPMAPQRHCSGRTRESLSHRPPACTILKSQITIIGTGVPMDVQDLLCRLVHWVLLCRTRWAQNGVHIWPKLICLDHTMCSSLLHTN